MKPFHGRIHTFLFSIVFTACRSQIFTINPIQYEPPCGMESGQGNFTIVIDFQLPEANREFFSDIVQLQVVPENDTEGDDPQTLNHISSEVHQLCAINIASCAPPAVLLVDTCFCEHVGSGLYTLVSNMRPRFSLSGKTIQAKIELKQQSHRPGRRRNNIDVWDDNGIEDVADEDFPSDVEDKRIVHDVMNDLVDSITDIPGDNNTLHNDTRHNNTQHNETDACDHFIPALVIPLGQLPPVYEPRENVTPIFVDSDGNPFDNDVFVCRGQYFTLTFCAFNVTTATVLKLTELEGGCHQQQSTCDCLVYNGRFTFDNQTMHQLYFSYQEDALCPRDGNFTVNVYEKTSNCSSDLCYESITNHTSLEPQAWTGCTHSNTVHVNGRVLACDTETDGGGWIVLQRRATSEVWFYNPWNRYENGFGNASSFWIGLATIHDICNADLGHLCELRVEMTSSGQSYFAHYSEFGLFNATEDFRLQLAGYSGESTAGDALETGIAFSTKDDDNDLYSGSCSHIHKGAWWYSDCGNSNLNGRWDSDNEIEKMFWGNITADTTEIKVRPRVLTLDN